MGDIISAEQRKEYYPPPDKRIRPDVPLVAPKVAGRKRAGEPDRDIAAAVSQVSKQNLTQWVQDLSAFHTRHTKSIYLQQAAGWLAERFKSFGYEDVKLHTYSTNGFDLENVVCTKPGSLDPGKTIVLCGHYDCIMESEHDSTSRAPGADDNASGISVILELARIVSQLKLGKTVQFVAFSGEEQGMWGSTAYAQHVQDSGTDIHRLINLDQVGYSRDMSVIIERDIGNQVSSNDQQSQEFSEVMARMAADYSSGINVKLGPIYASDYMPFEAKGYVVIGAYGGEGNPHYHHSSDTPETVNYAYLTEIARMTLATVVQEASLL